MLLVGGIAYGGYEYYDFNSNEVPAMQQEIDTRESALAAKQEEYRRLKEFAKNIESIKRELKELNVQLEASLEHMPRNFNFSGLLRRLTMLAQSSGVDLSTFKPARGEQKVEGQFYSTIEIEFELAGSFAQSLVFFDQVSRLKRIVNLQTMKMSPRRAEDGNFRAQGMLAETRVQLKTYRFVE
jgi:type IV pilus assembly protein PilO